jgi:sialate O-acetylesterase
MVLQRRIAVPVWGSAAANEAVTVTFRGQTKTATAGQDGKWRVNLDATEAGGPFELVAKGTNTVTIKDVLVGEVWLAGGQSNMAFNAKNLGGPLADSAKTMDHPNLRYMYHQLGGKWQVCTPTTALDLGSTGLYFGRDLQKALDIPVGILMSAIGGTHIERWMDPATLDEDPVLANDTAAGILYDRWIAPLAGYGIKGAIWYQGENNATFSDANKPTWILSNYRKRFEAMVTGWRKVWAMGTFPFYFVQLCSVNGKQTNPAESPWAELREAQRLSLTVPNTGMAVIIDLGVNADPNVADLHPWNKWDVGGRLARIARARDYGETALPYRGPMYKSMTVSGNKLKLVFSHAEGLRTAGNAKLTGMAIAGADNKWVWGDAVISQDTVIVSAASVAAPTKVRYGWGQFPPTNLYNAAGLPASPFQTDGPQLPVAMAKPPKAAAKAGHALEAPAGEACNVLGRKVDARTEGKVPAGNLLPPGR